MDALLEGDDAEARKLLRETVDFSVECVNTFVMLCFNVH